MPVKKTKQKNDYANSNFPDVLGFILWIAIRILFLIYLAWSLLPDSYLHARSITYNPNKMWSLSIPVYICVSFWCLIFGYVGYNYYYTLKWESINTIQDGLLNVQYKLILQI